MPISIAIEVIALFLIFLNTYSKIKNVSVCHLKKIIRINTIYELLMTINVRRSMITMAMPNGTHYTNKLTVVKSLIDHWQIIVAPL